MNQTLIGENMRRYLLIVPLLFACAKKENATADSAAAAAAPAALTDADFAGTWTGTAKLEGTDSTIANFTITCGSGSCRLVTAEAPKDTVASTYVIAGDSATGTSAAYPEPAMKGTMVVDHWVARPSGTNISGHGWGTLADKPDSVAIRYTFTGAKTP